MWMLNAQNTWLDSVEIIDILSFYSYLSLKV